MKEVVICEPLRTAVGRYGGMYKDVPAADLGRTVIEALLERTKIDPALIEDVIFGQCYPNGEAPAIGRVAALDAGVPVTVPGLQLDRRCGSGLQAVLDAAMRVQTGVCSLVLAGGADSGGPEVAPTRASATVMLSMPPWALAKSTSACASVGGCNPALPSPATVVATRSRNAAASEQ